MEDHFIQAPDGGRIQILDVEFLGEQPLIEIGQGVALNQVANLRCRQLLIGLSDPDIGFLEGKNGLVVRFGDLQFDDFAGAKPGAVSLPAQSRFPSSKAALIWATFAGPRPGAFRNSSLWARSIPPSPRNSFRSESARS
jgi:hypothetical protein